MGGNDAFARIAAAKPPRCRRSGSSAFRNGHGALWLVWAVLAGIGGPGLLGATPAAAANAVVKADPHGFIGSHSCQECHAKFYQLWSTSFHGLAMQPYTARNLRMGDG